MSTSPHWKMPLAAAGGFLAVFVIAMLGDAASLPLLMAPFGATCVIVFALPASPLATPRSVIGGHTVSTLVGLALLHTVGPNAWSLALGVALAIYLMQLTRTLHPPAGADPLVVLLAGAPWSFVVMPVIVGAVLIVLVARLYRIALRRYESG